jgi:hypothetical protein
MTTPDLIVIGCAVFGFLSQALVAVVFMWVKSTTQALQNENIRQDKHLEATDTRVEKLATTQQDHGIRLSLVEDHNERHHSAS